MTHAVILGWAGHSLHYNPLQDVPQIIIMSALSKLGLGDYPGDTNLYDWFLSKFKSNNFGAEIVTYGIAAGSPHGQHETTAATKMQDRSVFACLLMFVN